jgi:hypothetical protein
MRRRGKLELSLSPLNGRLPRDDKADDKAASRKPRTFKVSGHILD